MSLSNTSRSAPIAPSRPDAPPQRTSASRSRLATVLPRRHRGELAPALASAALAALLALQFALPIRTVLPEAVGVAPRRVAASPASRVVSRPEILQAPIFAPNRAGGAGLPGAPAGVDAYALVGIASGPGFATAFVKGPDGATRAVRPGQDLAGWRVAGLDRSQLVLTRGGERRALALGAQPAAGPTAATPPSATTPAAAPSGARGATDHMGVPPQMLAEDEGES